MTKSKSPVSYYGGKQTLAAWVVDAFPGCYREYTYVEAFGGGASVLYAKDPSRVEVLNDIDGDLVNFFKVLRERPGELVEALTYTPYSREEHAHCRDTYALDALDPVERARRYFVASQQSYAKIVGGHYSTSKTHRVGQTWVNRVDGLADAAARLRNVVVENLDFRRLFQKYDSPNTLWYLDPPYVPETRTSGGAVGKYRHEMTVQDHADLLAHAGRAEGRVVISGYASDLYDAVLLGGWRRYTKRVRCNAGRGEAREEVVWTNWFGETRG